MQKRTCVALAGILCALMLDGQSYAADRSDQAPIMTQGEGAHKSEGVIGISLHIGAERVGDPASLYIGKVHREGPAHQAGLRHGDELIHVDGAPVTGKSYEQVAKLIRGEVGSTVKLQIKREGEDSPRDIAVTRVAGNNLSKRPSEHGTYKDKP